MLFSDVLTYHVVKGSTYAVALTEGEKIPTVEGKDIIAHEREGELKFVL